MTTTRDMTDEEIRNLGLEVLRKELGVAGMIRFLRHFDQGHGDYSVERHDWLDSLSVEDIVRDTDKNQK